MLTSFLAREDLSSIGNLASICSNTRGANDHVNADVLLQRATTSRITGRTPPPGPGEPPLASYSASASHRSKTGASGTARERPRRDGCNGDVVWPCGCHTSRRRRYDLSRTTCLKTTSKQSRLVESRGRGDEICWTERMDGWMDSTGRVLYSG